MSKISLYEISKEYKDLFEITQHESFDAETGELIDESEATKSLFDGLEDTLGNKLDNTQYISKELLSDSTALKDEAKRLNAKAKALDNKALYLKELMFGALNASENKKLKTQKFSFSISRSESVSIKDESELPREYVRIKKEADKAKIKKDLKDGVAIDGCSIQEKFNIGVR